MAIGAPPQAPVKYDGDHHFLAKDQVNVHLENTMPAVSYFVVFLHV